MVELADASRAADDFLFVRTTRNSLAELLRDYDWSELARERPEAHRWLCTATDVLLIRTAAAAEAEQGGVWLTAYDRQMQARIGLIAADLAPHLYAECPGREILEAGFRIRQLDGNPVDLPVPAHANFL